VTATGSCVDLAGLEELASLTAAGLRAGDRILLRGELGAGKTTFVRAMLRSLGVEGPIPSPSFTLVASYRCPGFWFHHADLYRLEGRPEELEQTGLCDLLESGDCVVAVEWAERLPECPGRVVRDVEILFAGDGLREVRIGAGNLAGDRDR